MEGDAAAATADFHEEWELLLDSPDSAFEAHRGYEGIGDGSGGLIRADYFSIDGSKEAYAKPLLPCEDPAESDNPGWVDPGYDFHLAGRKSGELRPDSSSDVSGERKLSDFGRLEENKDLEGFEGLGIKDGDVESGFDGAKVGDFDVKSEVVRGVFEESGEMKAYDGEQGSNQFSSDTSGDRLDVEKFDADESRAEQKDLGDEAEIAVVQKVNVGDGGRRRIVWWKVPFELMRYCVLRVSPVWSFSVVAAVVGLAILGRRLHKMRQKSRTLRLKVTLDDKKVSQFKSRAARLNEVFSVVKRVPIVRPALPGPAAGFAPSWPMMSLR